MVRSTDPHKVLKNKSSNFLVECSELLGAFVSKFIQCGQKRLALVYKFVLLILLSSSSSFLLQFEFGPV